MRKMKIEIDLLITDPARPVDEYLEEIIKSFRKEPKVKVFAYLLRPVSNRWDVRRLVGTIECDTFSETGEIMDRALRRGLQGLGITVSEELYNDIMKDGRSHYKDIPNEMIVDPKTIKGPKIQFFGTEISG